MGSSYGARTNLGLVAIKLRPLVVGQQPGYPAANWDAFFNWQNWKSMMVL